MAVNHCLSSTFHPPLETMLGPEITLPPPLSDSPPPPADSEVKHHEFTLYCHANTGSAEDPYPDFWPSGSDTFFLLNPNPTCNNGYIFYIFIFLYIYIYFYIFLHIFSYFLHIFYIFFHIFYIFFLHIFTYFYI